MWENHCGDEEYRAFWASVDAAVEEVATWPEWNVGVVVVWPNQSAARVLICEGSEAPSAEIGPS